MADTAPTERSAHPGSPLPAEREPKGPRAEPAASGRARAHWARRADPAHLHAAIEGWKAAVARNPSHTPGWLALAEAHAYLAQHHLPETAAADRQAAHRAGLAAAERALSQLAPDSPGASDLARERSAARSWRDLPRRAAPALYWWAIHLQGWSRAQGLPEALWHRAAVERALRRCAALDPAYAQAGPHRRLGELTAAGPLFASHAWPEALEHLERAVALAPGYLANRVALARHARRLGDWALFERELEQVLHADPAADPATRAENRAAMRAARALVERSARGRLVIKLATAEPAGSPLAQQLTGFAAYLREAAGERVRVKLFVDGALGDETQLAEQAHDGRVQVIAVTTSALASRAPALAVLEGPYLFADEAHVRRTLDGPAREPVREALAKAGWIFGGWGPGSFRSWYAGKTVSVTSAGRFAGLRLGGSRPAPLAARISNAFGGSWHATSAAELSERLAEGTLDGVSAAPLEALASGAANASASVTLSQHSYQPAAIVYSARWYHGLPEDLRQILDAHPDTLSTRARQAMTTFERAYRTRLAAGRQITRLDAQVQAELERAAAPLLEALVEETGTAGRALWDAVQASRPAGQSR